LGNQPAVPILHSDPSGFPNSTRGPQSFLESVRNPKIITKRSLASEKSSKIAPKLQKFIFPTTTPNPVILVPKFLESLPLPFYAFIFHMFVAFIN
jgi:hypothetical protein